MLWCLTYCKITLSVINYINDLFWYACSCEIRYVYWLEVLSNAHLQIYRQGTQSCMLFEVWVVLISEDQEQLLKMCQWPNKYLSTYFLTPLIFLLMAKEYILYTCIMSWSVSLPPLPVTAIHVLPGFTWCRGHKFGLVNPYNPSWF